MTRLIVCTIAFVAVMLVLKMAVTWFVYSHGASWLEIGALFVALLMIGFVVDRRDRQRDMAD